MSKLSVSGLSGIPETLNQITIPAGNILDVEGHVFNTSTSAFQLPAGTTAQRPASPSAGYMRWNTSDLKIEIYNGSSWTQYTVQGTGGTVSNLGQSSATAATSASAILAVNPGAPDGVYWINHGSGAYQTYCLMEAGGFMMVGKIPESPDDTSNPWSYSGARWSQQSTTNEAQCQTTGGGDALNRGYYGYTLQEGFILAMGDYRNWLYPKSIPMTGVTARGAFTGGQTNISSVDRENFLSWIGNTGISRNNWDNQPHCNRIGFNRTDSSSTGMRFGITMNNENECNSNDSAIGFGCYTNNQSTSGDRNCAAGGFRWSGTVRYPKNGWIFVK